MGNILKGMLTEAGLRNPDWLEDPESYEKHYAPKTKHDYADDDSYNTDIDDEQRKQNRELAKLKSEVKINYINKEGVAPNGERYNMAFIVNSKTPQQGDNEIYKFNDAHWGAKKIVDTAKKKPDEEGEPYKTIVYYIDNHKYGHFKPFKDEPQVDETTQFSSELMSEGISQERLAEILFNRLEFRYPDIVSKYGHEVVGNAVMDVASFHQGVEELGTSDIGIMLRQVIKLLEEYGINEGNPHNKSYTYEMILDNGKVENFKANSEDEAKMIANRHGAKSLIMLGDEINIKAAEVKEIILDLDKSPELTDEGQIYASGGGYGGGGMRWYRPKDNLGENDNIEEDLRKWFKEKWVRFGPDGKIRGACARGDDSEGKPKCLPQAKAHALGKKGRKYAANKKRREDPNPERSGKAINVATKKKTSENTVTPFTGRTVVIYDAKGNVIDKLDINVAAQKYGLKPQDIQNQLKTQEYTTIQGTKGPVTVGRPIVSEISANTLQRAANKASQLSSPKDYVSFGVSQDAADKLAALRQKQSDKFSHAAQSARDKEKLAKLASPAALRKAGLANTSKQQEVVEGASENAWNAGISDKDFIEKFGKAEFDRLAKKYGQTSIPVPDLYGYIAKEPTDKRVRFHRGIEGPGEKLKSFIKKQGVAEGLTKQARARKEAESVKSAIARLEGELKNPNLTDKDKENIQDRLEHEKRRLKLYKDVLDEQGVAEVTVDEMAAAGNFGNRTWYHGTSKRAYEKMLKTKVVQPFLADNYSVGEAIWLTSDPYEALSYGPILLAIDNQIAKQYKFERFSGYPHGFRKKLDLKRQPDDGYHMVIKEPVPLKYFTKLDKNSLTEEQLDELKCWPGYTRVQGVPAGAPGSCKKKTNEEEIQEKWSQKYKDSINCSNPKGFSQRAHCAGKKKRTNEGHQQCPECGGPMYSEEMINEKKDACYYKVKSRYKVWPSAYASGALVKCRKKGASNWGTGGKKNEGMVMGVSSDASSAGSKVQGEAANPAQQAAIAIAMKKAGKKPKGESAIMKGLVDENLGTPYPGTYEQETAPLRRKGSERTMKIAFEGKKNVK